MCAIQSKKSSWPTAKNPARQSRNQRNLTAESAKIAEVESILFVFSVFSVVGLLRLGSICGSGYVPGVHFHAAPDGVCF